MTGGAPENGDDDEGSQRGRVLALGLLVVLAVIAVAIVFYLRREGRIEDCLRAGHANCDRLLHAP